MTKALCSYSPIVEGQALMLEKLILGVLKDDIYKDNWMQWEYFKLAMNHYKEK